MKIVRYKKQQRTIKFYANNYGFHEPYQILIDGTFCFEALQNQINIKDQLEKYFHSKLKLLTTQCVIIETESLGGKVLGAAKIVKQFPLHKCGHEKEPKSGSNCILSMVKNKNKDRYIIATQDRDLQEKMRIKPGVPLLYLHNKAPCLESPSEITKAKAQQKVEETFGVRNTEAEVLAKLKQNEGIREESSSDYNNKKKRKKKGGMNPMLLKKKKKNVGVKKRTRNRIRLPKELKNELLTK